MPAIELDILFAYLVNEDRHHKIAKRYFSQVASQHLEKPSITPFALQELELGIRAGKILPHGKVVKEETAIGEYMNEICEALEFHGLRIQNVECSIFARAARIREEYGLSYYDSLHGAAAMSLEDKSIVSTYPKYSEVKGLNRIDPYRIDLEDNDSERR